MGVSAASRLQRRDCSVVMGVTAASWLQCRALDLDVCVAWCVGAGTGIARWTALWMTMSRPTCRCHGRCWILV